VSGDILPARQAICVIDAIDLAPIEIPEVSVEPIQRFETAIRVLIQDSLLKCRT
jgi:hypothetical protein